jgi:hypothetical protein
MLLGCVAQSPRLPGKTNMIMKIELTTVGEDYGKVEVNGKEYEIALTTWKAIKRLFDAVIILIGA